MPSAEAQIRCAPDRATVDIMGFSSQLRKIASTREASSRGARQNSISPSIIILQAKPDKSSTFMTRLNRDDISPMQLENFLDSVMKLDSETSRRNFSSSALPQVLMAFLSWASPSTVLVEIGPKPADTIRKGRGRLSFRILPISGAPGAGLALNPPEETAATVPQPASHSTSQMRPIWAARDTAKHSAIA